MPVYTKASRARLAAREEVDDEYGDLEEQEDQDFTLLWRGPSSIPPSRSSAPPPSRRDRVSSAPLRRSERPPPPRSTPPPPPSFPAPQRTEMRAHAAPAHAEPPRVLELKVSERRWKIVVRASVLLTVGCVIGISTEVLIQRRGNDVTPDPAMTTSATFPLQSSTMASPSPAPTPTQCMSAATATSPLPPVENEAATIAHAVHHHRHHAPDAAQGTPSGPENPRAAAAPADPVLPDDIAAAAAEALAKAQQETMLP